MPLSTVLRLGSAANRIPLVGADVVPVVASARWYLSSAILLDA
ncbi:hypothetical protein AB0O52_08885 [Arthrobacter sp. NPDC080073]